MNSDEKFRAILGCVFFGTIIAITIALVFFPPEPPPQKVIRLPDVGEAAEKGSEHISRGFARGLIKGVKDGFKKEEDDD